MKQKSIILLIMLLIIQAVATSCGAAGARVALEQGIGAVCRGEHEKAAAYFGEAYSAKVAEREFDDEQAAVYRALAGEIKVSYTGEDELDGGICYIPVEIARVDLDGLSSYVSRDVSVFGVSAIDRIEELIDDGTVRENFIITEKCKLKAELSDGKWVINVSQAENAPLYEAFGLSGFARWLENQG